MSRLKNIARRALVGLGRRKGNSARTVVLCYHSIHSDKAYASLSPQEFERHLSWLRRHCDVVPFADIQSDPPHERPRIAITFDDGYADNAEIAAPLLARFSMPATFFITAGLIERDPAVLAHFRRERDADDIDSMSWPQIRSLHAQGFAIGSHTYSHPNLATLTKSECERELTRSKELIEQRLGARISTLAYPYGKIGRHVTDETIEIARAAGYRHAAAIVFRAVRPSDSVLAIPRFYIAHDDTERLAEKISGAWDVLGAVQERCPTWLARIFSPSDFTRGALRA